MSVNDKLYTLLLFVQVLNVLAMFIVAYYVLRHWSNRTHGYLFASAVAIIINNTGYLFEMLGKDSNSALLGTQFSYLGKPFIALTMFLFTADLCKFKINSAWKKVLYIGAVLITVLVLSCRYQDLYYSSVTFTNSGFFPHNVYGHGIAYYLYMISLVGYQVMAIVLIVRRYRKVRASKEKRQLVGTALMSLVVMVGLGIFFTGVTGGYDTTQLAYFVCALIFVLFMVRYNSFEDFELVRNFLAENTDEGIIAVEGIDSEIFYYNDIAAAIYPELNNKQVKYAKDLKVNPFVEKKIFVNKKIYETSVKEVFSEKGYEQRLLVILNDVTETYKQTQSLRTEVIRKTEDITRIQKSVIMSLADMVEARDGYTGAHIKNTQDYVRIIVEGLIEEGYKEDGFDENEGYMIIDAAPLHDIGKISVPDSILGKPGKLTDEEYEIIKKHTIDGANIVDQTLNNVEDDEYLETAHEIALYHHEKWDGTGYPIGLMGKEIPIGARIMAVADVYDALTSERSYKAAFTSEKASEILIEGRGKHFDSHLVDVFLDKLNKGASIANL